MLSTRERRLAEPSSLVFKARLSSMHTDRLLVDNTHLLHVSVSGSVTCLPLFSSFLISMAFAQAGTTDGDVFAKRKIACKTKNTVR